MKLRDLLKDVETEKVVGDLNRNINGLAYHSNQVKQGNVFIAIPGLKTDGHSFIQNAIDNGASAIVVNQDTQIPEGITLIRVKDTRQTLSKMSANFFNHPSKEITLIGVTGTNGKTTTTYLTKQILDVANQNASMIGTTGTVINHEFQTTTHTTPESLNLQELFYLMRDSGVDTCVMEVSSHAIQLKRVEDCNFNIGVFTNLTHEHLDFHKDMESYYKVKRQLFYKTCNWNIVNVDDKYGYRLAREIKYLGPSLLTYGLDEEADIYAAEISLSESQSYFELETPQGTIDITIKFPGIFNVYNSLAAASCSIALGIPLDKIKMGLESVESIPGRFEVIPTNRDLTVIIDYAHTPDGFKNILETVRTFAKGKIIIVFGCVGERDQSKRSIMGEIAASYCDLCILTTDNCRSEDPVLIANAVKKGFQNVNGAYIEIPDRTEAIRYAIKHSMPNDTVLITGKGHEQYQIIGENIMYFNEREIIKQVLTEINETNLFIM